MSPAFAPLRGEGHYGVPPGLLTAGRAEGPGRGTVEGIIQATPFSAKQGAQHVKASWKAPQKTLLEEGLVRLSDRFIQNMIS